MQILDNDSMRRADHVTIHELGVPSLTLMERAGTVVTAQVLSLLEGEAGRVAVVCGKGNNGGDGLVVARHLAAKGIDTTVLVLAGASELSPDATANLKRALSSLVRVKHLAPNALASTRLATFDLVVDAIFGTGLGRAVSPPWDAPIEAVNAAGRPVLAVDLPSGLSGSSGELLGATVRATRTVALAAPKLPHVLHPAHELCGEVIVADIGIASETLDKVTIGLRAITAADVLAAFPPRPLDSHKVTFGRLFMALGSRGMPGAALLAAHGALMGGAGLITLASVPGVASLVAPRFSDVLHAVLPETPGGAIAGEAAPAALAASQEATAGLIGPGLTRTTPARDFALAFIRNFPHPLVVDADGLNAIADAEALDLVASRVAPTVLTPHPGELRRLLPEGQGDRIALARQLAVKSKAVVVLKGHRTVVAEPGGDAAVCLTGCPALARGGTGDVLAGLLASILARGLAPTTAACAAVYLHGLAGQILARSRTEHMVPASVLADALPDALQLTAIRAGSAKEHGTKPLALAEI